MNNRTIEVFSSDPIFANNHTWIQDLFHSLDRLADFKLPPGDLSVALLNEQEIIELHDTYLEDPTPTDVITFPGDAALGFAGEICVCIDVAKERAEEFKQTFDEELRLYLIHGWLHLVGYDDLTEADAQKMRQAEKTVLSALSALKS
jgi:probable rRNA maturation factor